MMLRQHIVLDLLTEPSETAHKELISHLQTLLSGTPCTGLTVLTAATHTHGFLVSAMPGLSTTATTTVVSESPIDAMFKAKTQLDDAEVREFLLVTSILQKKYWENVLVHLLSGVHVWAVLGVVVKSSVEEVHDPSQVEADVRSYLRSLPSIGEVQVLRPEIIPDNMFNAGYSSRSGGVSRYSTMSSLNLLFTPKKIDPIAVVKENRRRLAVKAGFDPESLEITRVEHGRGVWVVGDSPRPSKYDGIVTNTPGVTLAAAGADCCVILLADVRTGACGITHAGWMGTVLGAVKATLSAMIEQLGSQPQDIRASIGPSLEGDCFDIPAKDILPLTDLDPTLAWPAKGKEGWVHADLPRANARMLESMGVVSSNIDLRTSECTVCHKEKYFSHRRDGVPFGNQWGFISCRETSID